MRFDELGSLEYIDVREVWDHESQDFTPWLGNNLERVGAAIGIHDLELVETEMAVGRYRADIVAVSPNDGTRVLIENQLGEADLQHLGQVIAYLAGLDAKVVVWVATRFREELLAAIRWLNGHTPAPFEFYAVEVGLVRIGDSLPAPVFDVLERPNDWERAVQSKVSQGEESEHDELRREFWQHYNERCEDEDVDIADRPYRSVYWAAADGIQVLTSFNVRRRDVAVYLQIPDPDDEDEAALMDDYLDRISEKLPDDEVRLRLFKNQWCKTILKIDTADPDNWDQIVDWLEERRKVYLSVVGEGEDDEVELR